MSHIGVKLSNGHSLVSPQDCGRFYLAINFMTLWYSRGVHKLDQRSMVIKKKKKKKIHA